MKNYFRMNCIGESARSHFNRRNNVAQSPIAQNVYRRVVLASRMSLLLCRCRHGENLSLSPALTLQLCRCFRRSNQHSCRDEHFNNKNKTQMKRDGKKNIKDFSSLNTFARRFYRQQKFRQSITARANSNKQKQSNNLFGYVFTFEWLWSVVCVQCAHLYLL